MNPYLERPTRWTSFHTHAITVLMRHVVSQVRSKYFVSIEERLYIHEPPASERRFFAQADVSITKPPSALSATGGATAVLYAPQYGTFPTGIEILKVRNLEIRTKDGDELVTVVELLSPSNKYAGEDREQYLGKRWELIRSPVNFIEIDLLRGGPRMPVDGLPACDYCTLVSRANDRPRVGIWAWQLRDPMPTIPIPLRTGDPSANIDLKSVLDQVYDEGDYADRIYAFEPEPKLKPDDAAWAKEFLPKRL